MPESLGGYTVGVLVQTNFGGTLTINGAPVGRELGNYAYRRELETVGVDHNQEDGSIMMVVATDAPLNARSLDRIGMRAVIGLARTGSFASNGSGDVLGYQSGDRITWHRDAIRYFEALAEAAPERISVSRYAQTWEGRDLIYVVVTSAENMARIDEVKAGMQRLVDPRQTTRAEAEEIIASQPAVTWLSYGVHGNEISSTDAAMLTAYHLLASRGDARVADIMRDTVVVLDPMQNPDGRDRFVHHFEMSEGIVADSSRISPSTTSPGPAGAPIIIFLI